MYYCGMIQRQDTQAASYIPRIDLAEYHYDLPADRIAEYPLAERGSSRLLLGDAAHGAIEHHTFNRLPDLIPGDAMLVLNSTRVVRARIVMQRATGGRVELFLLEPVAPSRDPAVALGAHDESVWICMVGGARKLEREGALHGAYRLSDGRSLALDAIHEGRSQEGSQIRFCWSPGDVSFAEVLEAVGRIPLPPYIKRDATDADAETYQTVYAREGGAVAAPTAGLHFTPALLDALRTRGVRFAELTLHVGAGTFKQVKGNASEHEMHRERIAVSAETLRALIEQAERRRDSDGAPFVIVGTTSLRTIESLYWFGVRCIMGEAGDATELEVEQWDPYRLEAEQGSLPDLPESFAAVDRWRRERGLDGITGRTGIMIVPGYTFRACDALITNFHQPESTLILLVGALLGRELWRRVYDEALATGYRFLSYGDSSMLIRDSGRMRRSDEG